MAVEAINLNGHQITTLKELLRPGLKAVFVGLNPAPISVEKKHYYQGPRQNPPAGKGTVFLGLSTVKPPG